MPRKKQNYGRVSPRAVERTEALNRALSLRLAGLTYREIALALNEDETLEVLPKRGKGRARWTQRNVHRMLTDYYTTVAADTRDSGAQLVDLMEQRLEDLYRRSSRPGKQHLEPREVEACVKIMERLAKLRGLDAPVKQEVKVSHDELTDPEVVALLEQLRVQLEALPPPPTSGLLPGEAPSSLAPIDVEIELPAPPHEPHELHELDELDEPDVEAEGE